MDKAICVGQTHDGMSQPFTILKQFLALFEVFKPFQTLSNVTFIIN